MDHNLAFTAGWNSSIAAFFFLGASLKSLQDKQGFWAVINAACVYFMVSDAVKFFSL